MPSFFDPENLTDAQRARWNDAVTEYTRIITRNIERDIAAMTPDEHDRTLALFRLTTPNDTRPLLEHFLMMHKVMHGNVGDTNSALFARLLAGKAPLPKAPPTSYAYPWYAVIEEPGPFPVSISQTLPFEDGKADGVALPETPTHLLINQCPWEIVSMNPAASRLFALERQLKASEDKPDGQLSAVYRWTPEFVEEVKAAYREGPVLIVKNKTWAEYRLKLGRRQCHAQRGDLQGAIHRLEASPEDALKHHRSVFDMWRFYFNVEIGKTILPGEHPLERLDRINTSNVLGCKITALFADAQQSGLEDDIQRFYADPAQFDSIRMTFDDWVLEKTVLMAPYSDADIQRLNEWQTRPRPAEHGPTLTCPKKHKGNHRTVGGETGILIATHDGWVCPDCAHTQDWAPLHVGQGSDVGIDPITRPVVSPQTSG